MNYKEVLTEINRCNLCTYFILPLVGLTEKSFGGIFVNSFISHDPLSIVVQVASVELITKECRKKAIHLWGNNHGGFIQYHIAVPWAKDVAKFCRGEYSSMSKAAKDIIKERSGLIYRDDSSGEDRTDIRLLALDGEEAVRVYWERELQCKIDPNQELLSNPPETSFITVKRV